MRFITVSIALLGVLNAAASKLLSGTIVVDSLGTKLAYTDTGAPPLSSSHSSYTTIFAVHGMAFNYGIFERVQALQGSYRIVAISRRHYAGSTPYNADELRVVNNGTDAEKTAFTRNRGLEINTFIDTFIQKNNVPYKFSGNTKNSGIALIGWSLGNAVTLAAINNLNASSAAIQARIAPNLHTLILHEPSTNILGLAVDPRNWVPWTIFDVTIPERYEIALFAEWVAGYFQHGDLSTRNADVLSFLPHGFNLRPPTVYSIARANRSSIMDLSDNSKLEIPYQLNFIPQLLVQYEYLYTPEFKALFPNTKNFFIGCEQTASFGPITTWKIQDDDKAAGGGFIKAKLIPGINHMSAWDDPKITLDLYSQCIQRTF
jgi:pimeloyl-ACP methyl ester carboxylesterase